MFEDGQVAGEALGFLGGHQVGADHGDAVVADDHDRVAGVLGQGGQAVAGAQQGGFGQDDHGAPGHDHGGRGGGLVGRAGRWVVAAEDPLGFGGGEGPPGGPVVGPGHGQDGVIAYPQGQGAPHHLLDTGMQLVTGRMIHVHHHPIRHHHQPPHPPTPEGRIEPGRGAGRAPGDLVQPAPRSGSGGQKPAAKHDQAASARVRQAS